jgi:tetratricopeptide (TPR) repeat protein
MALTLRRRKKPAKGLISETMTKQRPVNSPSQRNIQVFRIVAATLVPLLLLGLLEVGLRLAGYGHPTSFFISRTINGREVLVENENFGFSFFPRGVARSPAPIVLPKEKAPNTYRIFIFGESAALGDPKPAYGFSRYLEVLLKERYPSTKFEVVCVAMTAINSHAILPIARECSRLQGDLWILYMGNNEFIGPFGSAGLFGKSAPGTTLVRATLALRKTRIGQLIENLKERLNSKNSQKQWLGLKGLAGQEIAADDPIRRRVEQNLKQNLQDILKAGQKSGTKIIVSTVASNLKNCAPIASVHSRKLSAADRSAFDIAYSRALGHTNEAETLAGLGEAAAIDPSYAELQFRMGKLKESENKPEEARKSYLMARDSDALPIRTTSELNQTMQASELASKNGMITLLSLETNLAAKDEIPGRDLFFDHVHYNFHGNYEVARVLAEQIETLLLKNMVPKGEWPSEEFCSGRLGLTDWNRYLAAEMMVNRLSDAPYTNQLDNRESRMFYRSELVRFRQNTKATNTSFFRQAYREALTDNPSDFYLHQNFAEFLELSGKADEAIAEWRKIEQLIPQHPLAYFHAGRLLLRKEQFAEAESELRKALAIRDDFPDALIETGRCLAGQKRFKESLEFYKEALSFSPDSATAHFYMGNSFLGLGNRVDGISHIQEAIRLRPDYWEAHYVMGIQMAAKNEFVEAARHFEEVTRLKPEYPGGHFNLGVALAKLERLPEAATEFEMTLKLDPTHKAAREYLEELNRLSQRKK